jgi:hypothetical protein
MLYITERILAFSLSEMRRLWTILNREMTLSDIGFKEALCCSVENRQWETRAEAGRPIRSLWPSSRLRVTVTRSRVWPQRGGGVRFLIHFKGRARGIC